MANKTIGDFMGKKTTTKTRTAKRTASKSTKANRTYTRRARTNRNQTADVPMVQLRFPTNPQAAFLLGVTVGMTAQRN